MTITLKRLDICHQTGAEAYLRPLSLITWHLVADRSSQQAGLHKAARFGDLLDTVRAAAPNGR